MNPFIVIAVAIFTIIISSMSWKSIGIITGAVLAVSLGALFKFQSRLLYFPQMPTRDHIAEPHHYHMQHEDVQFQAKDGEKLHGWLLRDADKSPRAGTMIYFHGNAGNISMRLAHAAPFVRRYGMNVFLVSYRGYGKSTGIPSETGLRMDAQAALDYIRARDDLNRDKIVLFGESLGGAVTLDLASRNSDALAGVIVENTFTSIADMIDTVMPIMKLFKPLATERWRSLEDCIPTITAPILFVSGLSDELVPAAQMAKLHTASKSADKTLLTFEGGDHNGTWMRPGYFEQIGEWLLARM
eukprot:TRINITY_DN2663_c0_g1_i1.p1 TRINITY_DN2663_c0_g1~~TRINITY_DN2663_c0_g1_i1.p1  ORF type:complete len:299 (-),score=49.36 TRINITY_DN2663_c0_g1_i1:46-942(-)